MTPSQIEFFSLKATSVVVGGRSPDVRTAEFQRTFFCNGKAYIGSPSTQSKEEITVVSAIISVMITFLIYSSVRKLRVLFP
jgi:hypothetical protein